MVYKIITAEAPVNIAVIKYWGKKDEYNKIPLNDSISGTLSTSELSAKTTAILSDKYIHDKLWLNGAEVKLDDSSQAKRLLEELRQIYQQQQQAGNGEHPSLSEHKVHISSINNFPTAAGLASSAAGYACLAYVLGHLYGVTDPTRLSIIARKGSGSACRSLFGGFVQWHSGTDSESSKAEQLVDSSHWPQMRVIICVVNDSKKSVSSSLGMSNSVKTSELLRFRAESVVPQRIVSMKEAILNRNFQEFSTLTMQDSNQFHAVCMDTWPPLFYMNDSSKAIVNLCSTINNFYGFNKVAYTYDAGPNACIYLLDSYVDEMIALLREFFPTTATTKIDNNNIDEQEEKLLVKGLQYNKSAEINDKLLRHIEGVGFRKHVDSLKYIINTSIGDGPKLTENHTNVPEE